MENKIKDIEIAQDIEGKIRVENSNDEVKQIESEKEIIKDLKVKADPVDISSDDRKKAVKKLAGAISHSLRANGEINVRCFGNACIGKGSKAIAIANSYIETSDLQLACAPAFITTKIDDIELTGISFWTFATKKEDVKIDINNVKSVLMVKADSKDVSAEDRRDNVKRLAGAINHSLEENKECVIRCFGNATIGKATKAIAIARGLIATRGPDLYCWPVFIMTDMHGNERTGIAYYCFTNEL